MQKTKRHEWIRLEKEIATIGITRETEQELGEIVYVELPRIGALLKEGDLAVILETTKAAIDIYSPIEGEVVGVNMALHASPGLINSSPESDGWLFQVESKRSSSLPYAAERARDHTVLAG